MLFFFYILLFKSNYSCNTLHFEHISYIIHPRTYLRYLTGIYFERHTIVFPFTEFYGARTQSVSNIFQLENSNFSTSVRKTKCVYCIIDHNNTANIQQCRKVGHSSMKTNKKHQNTVCSVFFVWLLFINIQAFWWIFLALGVQQFLCYLVLMCAKRDIWER